ncbi:hypothetical protein, partial [Escherichia coli]|uniref:hypothetical protein n=3 Tax=Enterobacteriaceae TaxID=543 RepID=UPI001BC8AA0E
VSVESDFIKRHMKSFVSIKTRLHCYLQPSRALNERESVSLFCFFVETPCNTDVVMFFILLTVPPGKVPEHILPPAQADGRG